MSYVLVLVNYATHYPEAIPVGTITAQKVAEELLEVFTWGKLPQQIISDQSSRFLICVI